MSQLPVLFLYWLVVAANVQSSELAAGWLGVIRPTKETHSKLQMSLLGHSVSLVARQQQQQQRQRQRQQQQQQHLIADAARCMDDVCSAAIAGCISSTESLAAYQTTSQLASVHFFKCSYYICCKHHTCILLYFTLAGSPASNQFAPALW
jgi:hypothetical protein